LFSSFLKEGYTPRMLRKLNFRKPMYNSICVTIQTYLKTVLRSTNKESTGRKI
jgi:hypothetical protein